MNKIILPKTGNADVFKLVEAIDLEAPKKGEVKIDVHYSGLNFADIMMRLGLYPGAPKKPFVPGYEVSGLVKEVGEGVSEFKIGQKVIAGCHFGGYTDSLNLEVWQVRPLPNNLDLAQGASVTVSFLTAYMAFIELARVKKGDRVLIDCATGALGSSALQLLKKMELEIVGLTSNASKVATIEQRGAKGMTHETFYQDTSVKDFDVILNTRGGKTITDQYNRLSACGRIVCLGASSFISNGKKDLFQIIKGLIQMPKKGVIELMNDNKGIMGLNLLHLFNERELMEKALRSMNEYELRPYVDCIFKAEDISKAHRYLEMGQAKGKVLIQWRPNN